MAFDFLCVNCGHPQEEHNPNLVNEPAEGDFYWIETVQEGYRMDILRCMETRWASKYRRRVQRLFWGLEHIGQGYVSPDPKTEQDTYEAQPAYYGPQSVLIVFDPRRGYSVAVPIE